MELIQVVIDEVAALLDAADRREYLIARCERLFDEQVEPIDLPGPDTVIDPYLRAQVRPIIGALYDAAAAFLRKRGAA